MRIKLIFIIGFLAFSCAKKEEVKKNEPISISGSVTEYKLVQNLFDSYQESSEHKPLANIEGVGTNKGIRQFIRQEIHIANASRPLTGSEREQLKENGVEFGEHVFAIDALSIITDPKTGVDSLSTVNLSDIFTGRVDNWSQLGGKELPITIIGRNKNSGTRFYLENRFARYYGFGKNHMEFETNEEIIEKVENTKGAIGYVGIGYIMESFGTPIESVWTMPIYVEGGRASSPYEMLAITTGEYSLTRPLYQYFVKDNPKVDQFIKFEESELGQSLILESGFFKKTH